MLFRMCSRFTLYNRHAFVPYIVHRRLSQTTKLYLPIQSTPSQDNSSSSINHLIQRVDANDTRFTELEKRVEHLETLIRIFQHNLEGVINEQHIMNRKLCPSVWELYRVHNNGK
jgi:hypothetical protein